MGMSASEIQSIGLDKFSRKSKLPRISAVILADVRSLPGRSLIGFGQCFLAKFQILLQ